MAFGIGVLVPVTGEMLTRSDPLGNMLLFHGLAWLIMTTAGIYVSSLARNLVHAISILVPFAFVLGLALVGGLWLVEMLGPGPIQRYAAISAEQHFTAVIGALLFVALLWQAWRNGVPNMGEGLAWRFNMAAIAAVWLIAVLSVAGTRTRVWESLRSEPAPMPALATIPGVQPDVLAALTHVAVLTPEGCLWDYGSPGLYQGSKVLRQLGVEHTWLSMEDEGLVVETRDGGGPGNRIRGATEVHEPVRTEGRPTAGGGAEVDAGNRAGRL
jgi:hypothetical protein